MILRIGETYIDGKSGATARRIFEACSHVDVAASKVRTTDSGFVVPNEVAEELERMSVPSWAEERAVF